MGRIYRCTSIIALAFAIVFVTSGIASGGSSTRSENTFAANPEPTDGNASQVDKQALLLAKTGVQVSANTVGPFLEEKFPDSYGGLYATKPDGLAYTIVVVGDPAPIQAAVAARFATPGLVGPFPEVSYVPGKYSWARMIEAATEIMAREKPGPIGVVSAGPDVIRNGLRVDVVGSTEGLADRLANANGIPIVNVTPVEQAPVAMSRTVDSPPWKPGDSIKGSVYPGCSLGWATKNAYGYWVITAGHCGTDTWWNMHHASGTYSRLIGATAANLFTGGGPTADIQAIHTTGDVRFWRGNPGTPTNATFQGKAAVGQQVCNDGAVSKGSCGQVYAVGQLGYLCKPPVPGIPPICYTTPGSMFIAATPQPGDSGGPVWEYTPWGIAAVGLLNGGGPETGNPGKTVAQDIGALLSWWGMSVRTTLNP